MSRAVVVLRAARSRGQVPWRILLKHSMDTCTDRSPRWSEQACFSPVRHDSHVANPSYTDCKGNKAEALADKGFDHLRVSQFSGSCDGVKSRIDSLCCLPDARRSVFYASCKPSS